MRLPRTLHDDAVVIMRSVPGPVDDDGVPTRVNTPDPWDGVNVQQMTSEELTDAGRNTTVTTWRVSGPPIAVDSGDIIEWGGGTFLVDGEPDTRTGKFRIEHTALFMVRVKG